LGDALFGLADMGVDMDQVVDEFDSQAVPFGRRFALGPNNLEQLADLGDDDFLADPAGHELAGQGVEPAAHLAAPAAQVQVAASQPAQHRPMILGSSAASVGVRRAAMATERASLGSFLLERPLPSTRTRAAKVAGTSSTASPPATSCWDSR
jgi:hypothetical protein